MGATKREQPTIVSASDASDEEVIEFGDVAGAQHAPAGELLAQWGLNKADVMQVVADLGFRYDFRTAMRIAAGHAVRGPGNVELRRAFAKREIKLPADQKLRAAMLHYARLEGIGYDADRAEDFLIRAFWAEPDLHVRALHRIRVATLCADRDAPPVCPPAIEDGNGIVYSEPLNPARAGLRQSGARYTDQAGAPVWLPKAARG